MRFKWMKTGSPCGQRSSQTETKEDKRTMKADQRMKGRAERVDMKLERKDAVKT